MKARICLLAYLVCLVCTAGHAQIRGSHRYAQSGDRESGEDNISSRGSAQDNFRQKTSRSLHAARESPAASLQRQRVTAEAFERSFSTDHNSRRFPPRAAPEFDKTSHELEESSRVHSKSHGNPNQDSPTRRSSAQLRSRYSEKQLQTELPQARDHKQETHSRNSRISNSESHNAQLAEQSSTAQNPQNIRSRYSSTVTDSSVESVTNRFNRRNYLIPSRKTEPQTSPSLNNHNFPISDNVDEIPEQGKTLLSRNSGSSRHSLRSNENRHTSVHNTNENIPVVNSESKASQLSQKTSRDRAHYNGRDSARNTEIKASTRDEVGGSREQGRGVQDAQILSRRAQRVDANQRNTEQIPRHVTEHISDVKNTKSEKLQDSSRLVDLNRKSEQDIFDQSGTIRRTQFLPLRKSALKDFDDSGRQRGNTDHGRLEEQAHAESIQNGVRRETTESIIKRERNQINNNLERPTANYNRDDVDQTRSIKQGFKSRERQNKDGLGFNTKTTNLDKENPTDIKDTSHAHQRKQQKNESVRESKYTSSISDTVVKKDKLNKPNYRARDNERTQLSAVDEAAVDKNNRGLFRGRKQELNKSSSRTVTGTVENTSSKRDQIKDVDEDDNRDVKVNQAKLLSSRARLKNHRDNNNGEKSDRLLSTAETIIGRLSPRLQTNLNNDAIELNDDKPLQSQTRRKENAWQDKQKFKNNVTNSKFVNQEAQERRGSSGDENVPPKGEVRGATTYKKNPYEEGKPVRPATKKHSASGDDEGIDEDDNYPVEYKQLRKAGNGPKEILELLKARKAQREALQNSGEQLHASRASFLLASRPKLYHQVPRTELGEEKSIGSTTNPEKRFESNDNNNESQQSTNAWSNSRQTTSANLKESNAEDELERNHSPSRGRLFNKKKVDEPRSKSDVKSKQSSHEEERPSNENSKRTYARRDEQNKPIREFKLKPTPEVETERTKFIPSSRRQGTTREDSTETDTENDEVRVPGKLKYHLYESSSRKKLVNQQLRPVESSTTTNVLEDVRTVTRSYAKLARYPKLPAAVNQLPSTTETSLAARLNARRLRQHQSTTPVDVPETLPPVTIVYASSFPTAKPLESDSLILEQSTTATNTTTVTSLQTDSSRTTASYDTTNAWPTEFAQKSDSTSDQSTSASSLSSSTNASAISDASVQENLLITTTSLPVNNLTDATSTITTLSSTLSTKTTTSLPPSSTKTNTLNTTTNNNSSNISTKPQHLNKSSKAQGTVSKGQNKHTNKNKNNAHVKTTTNIPLTTKTTTQKQIKSNEILKNLETNNLVSTSSTTASTLTSKTTSKPQPSSPINTVANSTTKTNLNAVQNITKPQISTTLAPKVSTRSVVLNSTKESNIVVMTTATTKVTEHTTKKSLPTQKPTTTKKPVTTGKTNQKVQSSNSVNGKGPGNATGKQFVSVTTPVFRNVTNTTFQTTAATLINKQSVVTKSPIITTTINVNTSTISASATTITTPNPTKLTTTSTVSTTQVTTTDKHERPNEQKQSFKELQNINLEQTRIAQQNILDEPELEESSHDFVVYGLLPNKSLVRRIPSPTPRTELPFVVYGLYPNGTIVRRFPNGTIIPDDPQETNELVADTVDPADKSAISQLLQRVQPPPRTTTTFIPSTSQATVVFTTVPPTTKGESSTAPTKAAVTDPPTTVKITTTTTTTSKPTTTMKPTTTTMKPTTTSTTTVKPVTTTTTTIRPVTTSTTTTMKPVPTTTVKPSTIMAKLITTLKPETTTRKSSPAPSTTKKPKPKAVTTTRKPNTSAPKPKATKPPSGKSSSTKKPKQPPPVVSTTPTTVASTTTSTTTPRATTPAAIQSATRIAEDFALLNSLLMKKLPEDSINANSIQPELMSSTPSMDSDDLANRIIQLAIERAGPGSTPPTPASAIITLAGTQPSSLQDLTANSNTFASPISTTNSPDSTAASSKPSGKISVWVVPQAEMNASDSDRTTTTVPKLTPQEEQVLNALLSSPSPTPDQLLLAELLSGNPAASSMTTSTTTSSTTGGNTKKPRKAKTTATPSSTTQRTLLPTLAIFNGQRQRGGGFLRSLGSNTNVDPEDDEDTNGADDSNETTPEPQTPQRPLISAAINMSRAVSQFMGLVIQDAVQQFQAYLEERLNVIFDQTSRNTTTVAAVNS